MGYYLEQFFETADETLSETESECEEFEEDILDDYEVVALYERLKYNSGFNPDFLCKMTSSDLYTFVTEQQKNTSVYTYNISQFSTDVLCAFRELKQFYPRIKFDLNDFSTWCLEFSG